MSCIVRSYNKANNTTYVYESCSYRDPVSKKPRSHRRCIGKLDPTTGQVIPTGKRGRRKKETPPAAESNVENEHGKSSTPELAEVTTRLQDEQAKNKALSDEVRQLRHQMKQIETAMESLAKAVDKILAICK